MKDDCGSILILSSEPTVRLVMKEALERAGHVVLATGDLGTAVGMMSDCSFELLITHPYIECMPGHEAARYLRARRHQMGVLIVAGLIADDRIQVRAELEEFEVFPRPFTAGEFVDEVQRVLQNTRERTARNLAVRHD